MTKLKKIPSNSAILSFLLLINIVVHLWYFKIEEFDMPQATKKLIVDTVKNEMAVDQKKEVKNLENVLDGISYASQLGRLDTISLLLAMFGLILGFGAVAGFMHIKENAERVAEVEAINYIKSNGPKIISEYLERNLPAFIEKSEVQKNVQTSDDKLEDFSLSQIIKHMDDKIDNKN